MAALSLARAFSRVGRRARLQTRRPDKLPQLRKERAPTVHSAVVVTLSPQLLPYVVNLRDPPGLGQLKCALQRCDPMIHLA